MAFGVVSPGFWSVAIARQLWRLRDAQERRAEQIDPEQLGSAHEFHKGGELRTKAGVDFNQFLDAVEKRTDLDNELVADAYFLLMAVDHLLRYGPKYEKRTSDPRVRAALKPSKRSTPRSATCGT